MKTLLEISVMAIIMTLFLTTIYGILIIVVHDYIKKRSKIIFCIIIYTMFILATKEIHGLFDEMINNLLK